MQYIAEITLDVACPAAYRFIRAKQGDQQSRFVKATLAANGEVITPGSGVTAFFRAVKPDGSGIYNPATINNDGTVTLELTAQTLALPGTVSADVELREGSAILATASFLLQVEVNPLGNVDVESTSEFIALQQLIDDADELLDDMSEQVAEATAQADRAELAAETFTTDTTLTVPGKAADAAATGSRIGTLASLTTTAKSSIVAAINEVDGDIGNLASLTTTAKANLVAALNELDSDISTLNSNCVHKTGDTMTGALRNDAGGFRRRDTDITVGTAPSMNHTATGYHIEDANGAIFANFRPRYNSDGSLGFDLMNSRIVNGSAVFNGMSFRIKDDGTRIIEVSDAAPWLSALGFAVASGTITVTAGSLSDGSLRKTGKTVVLHFVTTGSSVSASWAKIGSVPSAYAPAEMTFGVGLAGYTPIHVRVLTTGEIQARASAALSGQTVRTNMSWITA